MVVATGSPSELVFMFTVAEPLVGLTAGDLMRVVEPITLLRVPSFLVDQPKKVRSSPL